jgi:hypothetical protein
MAFNPAPPSWIASWSSDGTNITIPIASLQGLVAGEAHNSTGDIRACVLAILDTLYNAYKDEVAADRPVRMTIRRNTVDSLTSTRQTFTVEFTLESLSSEVADE